MKKVRYPFDRIKAHLMADQNIMRDIMRDVF